MAGMPNRRMDARKFCDRYPVLKRHIDRNYPGFWQDLGDTLLQMKERQCTTRGAIVREYPQARDSATQTERRVRTVGLQVAMKRPAIREMGSMTGGKKVRVSDVGVQVGVTRADRREQGVQVGDGPRDGMEKESRRRATPPTASSQAPAAQPDRAGEVEKCWSCGSTAHFVSTCPTRKEARYCYRCGRAGVSVKTCPKCREGWRSQGPFLFGEGHPGGEPLLRRGGPPGSRRAQNPHGAIAYDPRMTRCATRWPPGGYQADPTDPDFMFVHRH